MIVWKFSTCSGVESICYVEVPTPNTVLSSALKLFLGQTVKRFHNPGSSLMCFYWVLSRTASIFFEISAPEIFYVMKGTL